MPEATAGAILAVIPTLVLAGPTALLAALCPALFAALALLLRRWCVLLGVASLNSSLFLAHAWLRGHASGAWWGTPAALSVSLALVSGVGAIISLWRGGGHPANVATQAHPVLPALSVVGAVALGGSLFVLYQEMLWRSPWRECLPILMALAAAAIFLLVLRVMRGKQSASPSLVTAEPAILASLAAGYVLMAMVSVPPRAPEVIWTFEAVDRGVILSTPLLDGDRVYASAAHAAGLRSFGAVHCLDRRTGKSIWTFNRGERMKQALSSPTIDGGRLYVGEGLHEDADCGLYCLDAATGAEIWRFATSSHTESSPRVADGAVFFGAGDDGVYSLDADSGTLRWHFSGLHVDATPAIVGHRLYASSGYGNPEMFCLDSATGKPLWRTPSDVSVFGSPVVAGGQVYFGAGNGKLTRSDPQPAGALICLDAATGEKMWRYDVEDAVLCAPAVSGDFVYFASRDRHCYCLDRRTGRLRWRKDLGSPAVATPVVAGTCVYAVASGGSVHCLDAASGAALWAFDVGRYSRTTPELYSSPAVAVSAEESRLYLGTGLNYAVSSAAVVYCLKVPARAK